MSGPAAPGHSPRRPRGGAAPAHRPQLVRTERADLVDFLAGLPPEQWDAPTLCAGWAVRDVVAHVVSYGALGQAALARCRLSLHLVNALGVAELRDHSPAELVAQHLPARPVTFRSSRTTRRAQRPLPEVARQGT